MQKFMFIAALIFGGLYFAFKDKGMNDLQKAVGNPVPKGYKSKSEKKAEEAKPNKYEVGDCLKVANTSDWEVYKITKLDLDKKDYHYRLCVKFKGCQKETQKEIMTNFEYDFPPSRKVSCPR